MNSTTTNSMQVAMFKCRLLCNPPLHASKPRQRSIPHAKAELKSQQSTLSGNFNEISTHMILTTSETFIYFLIKKNSIITTD